MQTLYFLMIKFKLQQNLFKADTICSTKIKPWKKWERKPGTYDIQGYTIYCETKTESIRWIWKF